jgi:exopolyphosphatase/guanosine-5'-triphosphate,3'-diphosphate pyrophosphatase
METLSPLYAVIDLGSNSFHMLITRQLADSVQVVDKVKRKVRLAAGLNAENILSEQAIAKGLECLNFFAERLQDIPKENIRIVATATLRLAKNRDSFINKAQKILAHNIMLLSGLDEAQHIYLGVAHTSCSDDKRLVLDIGGASTEIIVGDGFTVHNALSLDMGCVTFTQQYFADNCLNEDNFSRAIACAKAQIVPIKASFQKIGWQCVLGGSGTMQALAEILMFAHSPTIITREFLQQIKIKLLTFSRISEIKIAGLSSERSPVIASGLAILIALFEEFDISRLKLSSGALREGLLYEMLPNSRDINIRQRTINALTQRFHIDQQHAQSVKQQALNLYAQLKQVWHLPNDNALSLLQASCDLHEVGLLLEFKYHQQHGAYILAHADLAGFSQSDRQLLVTLVRLYKGDIDTTALANQSITSKKSALHLLIILRLAIILCRRRKDDVLPHYQTKVTETQIHLCLPENWLAQHPLIADELIQEHQHLATVGFSLAIECQQNTR